MALCATLHLWRPAKAQAVVGLVGVRLGPVQDLEELGGLGPHPGVDVGLGALDVVVQVVPEQVNHVDGVVSHLLVGMPEKPYGEVFVFLKDRDWILYLGKRTKVM